MSIVIGLNAVIVAVTDEVPRILTVPPRRQELSAGPAGLAGSRFAGEEESEDALPLGPFDPGVDRTLELSLRRWVREQSGLELGYVEQLYTFGNRHRDPQEKTGGPRVVSVAYLALVREAQPSGGGARWRGWYEFFPWEDWRRERPAVINQAITPALRRWIQAAPNPTAREDRRERADIAFGLEGVSWDGERVLERYELLYEVGPLPEAHRDTVALNPRSLPDPPASYLPGRPMALDHRRILATALGRLRGKIRYRPVVFELLPPTFTLLQLQRVVEALSGVRLHKQNFRRLVERGGLVEGTGRFETQPRGRPAELFHFRREVLRERPAPGVGLPGVKT